MLMVWCSNFRKYKAKAPGSRKKQKQKSKLMCCVLYVSVCSTEKIPDNRHVSFHSFPRILVVVLQKAEQEEGRDQISNLRHENFQSDRGENSIEGETAKDNSCASFVQC